MDRCHLCCVYIYCMLYTLMRHKNSAQGNTSFCRLKTIVLVIQNTQGAEDVVKKYETRLREVHTVPTNTQEVENYCSELKVTCAVFIG